jgi:hypothetical protein
VGSFGEASRVDGLFAWWTDVARWLHVAAADSGCRIGQILLEKESQYRRATHVRSSRFLAVRLSAKGGLSIVGNSEKRAVLDQIDAPGNAIGDNDDNGDDNG